MISSVLWALALTALLVVAFYLIHLLLFAPKLIQSEDRAGAYPSVSVLKPLKAINKQIEDCVESFFKLDYDRFELFFA